MPDLSAIRCLSPNEEGAVLGIPVRRVGLLLYAIDADAAPWEPLTLDEAERVLDRMATLPPVDREPVPQRTAIMMRIAGALLRGATLTAGGYTVGPHLDEDGTIGSLTCTGSDGNLRATVEEWEEHTGGDSYFDIAVRRDADPSPFGVAASFVVAVGGAAALDALQALEGEAPAVEPVTPASLREVACYPGRSPQGDVVHSVVAERVELGRWVREPGQAVCKPRGLRLTRTTDARTCGLCSKEAEKRGIALSA